MQFVRRSLAMEEWYGKLTVQAEHFYVNPDKAKMVLVDVVEKKVDAVVERVKEAVVRILSEDFEVVKQPNCRFYDFMELCGISFPNKYKGSLQEIIICCVFFENI
ncbi:hypothetical protein [Methanolobus psychrotolerans]|uniref:hypothetical protein n=1 Tax=Methanolobus psychrotolerans TaxID=1874706 RepID=UPI0013E9F5D0|nr:hypothetical protein [Methanolobus psychrotolerans]